MSEVNPVDAFLIVTAISYFVAVISGKKYVRNVPLIAEKVLMGTICTALLIAVLYNVFLIYLVVGIASTASAVLTYRGNIQWIVAYKDEPSDAAQMFMAGWDLLVAVCCFIKIF